MRRYLIVFITLFLVALHAQDMQYSKIFYEQDANIYDAIYYLTITHGEALLSNKRPQSQAQLFNSITDLKLENMDDLSLRMHSVILGQLYGNYLFETEYLKFDTNLKLAFQLNGLYHPEYAPYHDRFASYNSMLAPLTVPLKVLISNYCYFYTDIVIEKNFAASELSHTYINIPFFQRDLDYHFPKRAGMSIGGSFFNLSFARGPFNVGRSLSGSMLIADTADRLDYFNASIFVVISDILASNLALSSADVVSDRGDESDCC